MMAKILRSLCAALLAIAGCTAYGATYTFPGALPTGCTGTGPIYTCPALSLAYGDIIVIASPKPATINISGNFSTNTSTINGAGVANDLTINVSGTLTTAFQAVIKAHVTAGVVNSTGTEVSFGGNVTTTTGAVTLAYKNLVAGTITTTTGAISLDNENVVSGAIASDSGAVTVGYRAKVIGSITTTGAVTTANEVEIGAIVGGAGNINLNYLGKVSGGITTSSGTITLGQSSTTGACVKSTSSAAISLGYQASVNSVCCGSTCGSACVTNNTTFSMPPACTSQLIAEYRMDELSWNGTSGEVKDSSGFGAHGTAKVASGSTPPATTAKVSPAYSVAAQSTCRYGEFDTSSGTVRTTSYVELPSMPSLSNGFSVTAWIRSTDVAASGQRIFVRDDNQNGWAISLGDGGAGRLRFFNRNINNSGAVTGQGQNPGIGVFVIDTNPVIAANNWYFVAATVDTTLKVITLYVYDTSATLLAKVSSAYSGTWIDGTGMAAIGGETSASSEGVNSNFHFKGNVDEVAFFTGAQTQTQIAARLSNVRSCTVETTCIVDDFSTGTLNAALWNPLAIGGTFVPQVVDVGGQKRLRMTTASGNQATLVQLKKWFPAAGNKIVVQFDHYVYGGNGADGTGVVFSDASVAPSPGANGGSLGFAQKTGVNGFAGGWLGIGIDEFGNFPNPTEGRVGYPGGWAGPAGANVSAARYANSVSVRGSGTGTTGYSLLANSGTLATPIWANTNTSATVQKYRITIDNSNNTNAYVTVQRDTSGTGGSYSTVIPTFDVLSAGTGQSAVPANLLVSFTSGTGGSNNIHELANISICANYVIDPGGSTTADNFECVETGVNIPWVATARKPLYTKLVGTGFSFDVAALKADGTLETNYVAAGGNSKYAKVELFDDTTPAASCSAYSGAVASQTVTFASGSFSGAAGRTLTSAFNLATPYRKLRCRVKECTDSSCTNFTAVNPGCSSDQFAVRPAAATLVTTATAAAPSAASTPAFKAGANFTLRATTNASASYSGNWTLDATKLTAQTPTQDVTQQNGGAVGSLSPATLVANAAAVNATYSEVGYVYLDAGAYADTSFAAVDRATGDCITSTTAGANLSDTISARKYGCDIGNRTAVSLGRFYPDHFSVTAPVFTASCSVSSPFTYFGQDGFGTAFTVKAENADGVTTANYSGAFAKLNLATYAAYGFAASPLPAGSAISTSSTAPIGTWGAGTANVVVRHQISRPTALAGASLITVTAAPTDGEVPASAATAVANNASFRYGRLRLQNAYGSEKLALSVPAQAQYYDSTLGSFRLNTDDSCTALSVPAKRTLAAAESPDGSANMYFYTGVAGNQIVQANTNATAPATLSAGVANINFSAPGTVGWVDLILATQDYLKYNWGNCSGQTGTAGLMDDLPCARATFGIYKSPLIYRRENY